MKKRKSIEWRKILFAIIAVLTITSMIVVELLTLLAPP